MARNERPQRRDSGDPKKQLTVVEAELGRGVATKFNAQRVVNLEWQAEKRYVMAILADPDKDFLREMAAKNPDSVVNAVLDAARLGLSLSPVLKHAYLIPYGGKSPRVVLQPSYLGMEQAVLRSEKITLIQTGLVYENDSWEEWTTADGAKFEHRPARKDRGALERAYCLAKFANGETHVEVMSAEEIQACKDAAKRKNNGKLSPAWEFFETEMQKKCVVRRAAKHWPSDQHVSNLMAHLDKVDPMEFRNDKTIEGEAVEVLNDEDIKGLEASIPRVPEPARPMWLLRVAQSLQFKGIDEVPREKLDEVKEKLAAAQEKMYPAPKVENADG